MPYPNVRGLQQAAGFTPYRNEALEGFQDQARASQEAVAAQNTPWASYDRTLHNIAADPSATSQNWELAHLQDPDQQGMGLSSGGPWQQFSNVLRHRGAMMGKEIGFNPKAEAIARGEDQLDQIDQTQLRNRQLRTAAPTLRTAGR